MPWVAYISRVLINLLHLIVVVAVLAGIRDPSERAITSLLGMLYVTIRSQAVMREITDSDVAFAITKKLDLIYYQLDHSFEIPDKRAARTAIATEQVKLYIDAVFLFLISLACLWTFFTAH